MKSTKHRLLQADFNQACKELKERREMIEDLREENKLLIELASSQLQLIKFVNKIMFETTKHQRSLPIEEQNSELLDLAWSTNDCLGDTPRQKELIELLKVKGVDITK
ncbi:hypothetical protein [Terribacillus saccharophilus]|uniref:hypothetical protein n=1 Tax=Terribacillus saccharophilus TaxID=361277 RepID=UPI000BA4EACD|nr:hypothetical protein [Terribacillus saccharophilus]PAF19731.1 hypothetical protein CHH51_01325 [Terribacillus saccharophilus]